MKKTNLLILSILFILLSFHDVSFSQIYDGFTGPYIDVSKWLNTENVREIVGGKLALKLGNDNPLQITRYPYVQHNTLSLPAPNAVDSIQAEVAILSGSAVTGQGYTRARLAGRWYNDGTEGPGMTGDIWAEIAIRQDTTGLKVMYGCSKFTNSDGSNWVDLWGGTFSTAISLETTYTLYINYDRVANQFTFRLGAEEATIGPTRLPPRVDFAQVPLKQIGVRTEIRDASSSAFISATFDNASLTTSQNVPPAGTILVEPSGLLKDNTPTYKWKAVSNATYYWLYVDDSTGNKINKWYTAAQANCPTGTGECYMTPTTVVEGSCQWWVDTYNNFGYGPWSAPLQFSLDPGTATLISPSGNIGTNTPQYRWSAISNADYYYLWVNDFRGNAIGQWYTAAQANCASGTGECSVTPTTEVYGSCQWWVQTYNFAEGFGPWSASLSFKAPGEAELISPSGSQGTTRPTYVWSAVSNATWYQLWVNDCGGNKIKQWYTAAQAGCPVGIGTCSVTPPTGVVGSCQWWVETYFASGFGPWSDPLSFSTPSTLPDGQSNWYGTWTSYYDSSSYASGYIIRSGNNLSAQFQVSGSDFGNTLTATGTISGNSFNMNGSLGWSSISVSGTASCTLTGTYYVTDGYYYDAGYFSMTRN